MAMSRLQLAKIRALTFYQDSETKSRRGDRVPQLTCIGKPCQLYQPEVVRCESLGGSGTDIDWKCEADLPEQLRFGRVEVSCEGWDGPGDSHVLKGSCALQYRLVRIGGDDSYGDRSLSGTAFMIVWFIVLVAILAAFLSTCLRPSENRVPGQNNPRPGSGGGYFPGGTDPDQGFNDQPPPYSKSPQDHPNRGETGWRPGFWTGATAAWAGNAIYNRMRSGNDGGRRMAYDWERDRDRGVRRGFTSGMPTSGGYRGSTYDDRGEGSSNLGSMRSSTGLGGTNVR